MPLALPCTLEVQSAPGQDVSYESEGGLSTCAAAAFAQGFQPGVIKLATLCEDWSCLRASPACTGASSLGHWSQADETLILLDWDDTLCPTTFISEDERLRWNLPAPCFASEFVEDDDMTHLRDGLTRHADTVAELLRLAVCFGRVVIVTLAEEPWVETSIKNFMPSLEGLLKELAIDVVYCRRAIPSYMLRQAREDGVSWAMISKRKAMSRVIRRFYGKGAGCRGWRNVLSIGDSDSERHALQDVIFRNAHLDRRNVSNDCRCKVLKLITEPSLPQLTAELQVLALRWRTLVCHDGDIDIDFGSPISEADGATGVGYSVFDCQAISVE